MGLDSTSHDVHHGRARIASEPPTACYSHHGAFAPRDCRTFRKLPAPVDPAAGMSEHTIAHLLVCVVPRVNPGAAADVRACSAHGSCGSNLQLSFLFDLEIVDVPQRKLRTLPFQSTCFCVVVKQHTTIC